MTASVIEVISGTPTPASTTNYSVTTSLVSSDVVLVVYSKPSAGSHTLSGLGATWVPQGNRQVQSSGTVVYYSTATGVTGTGTVSLTLGSATTTPTITILVLRGMNATTLSATTDSTWFQVDGVSTGTQTNTTANTDEGAAAIAAGIDQIAVFVAVVQAGTATFPSNTTPSGWTTDTTVATGTGRHIVAHKVVTAAGNVQSNVQTTSLTTIGTTLMLFGTATSIPPLTSTFVGWGNPIF